MLPCSMRRVVTAIPASPLLSNLAPNATRATAAAVLSRPFSSRSQQRRRYSSSKPSSPNDSPKKIPTGQLTSSPSQSAKAESRSEAKSSGEKRRRKNGESANALGNIPSVPSTQNVPQESLALSGFFSLHRPMSVTQGFPKTVSDDDFAKIFAPQSKESQYSDIMSTLSRTVEDLEHPFQALTIEQGDNASTETNPEHVQKIDVRHPDGTESSIYVQLNAMSGQFIPFRPPPLPQPQSAQPAAETGAQEHAEMTPHHRVYKAVFTLEETTDSNGDVRILAHSPTVVEEEAAAAAAAAEDSPSSSFLERMALRELQRQERGGRSDKLVAISVRRQRKLKMKKKKYKKLMKRTRNERRKLHRI